MSESAPERGEIWWVDYEPAIGSEARKRRPSIVISAAALDRIGARLVVPLTTWRPRFSRQPNKAMVRRTEANGLADYCAADVKTRQMSRPPQQASQLLRERLA